MWSNFRLLAKPRGRPRLGGMNYKILGLATAVTLLATGSAWANKSSVEIVAPATVKAGETVTITLKVSHRGNNFIHHTRWAYVKVNGAEVGRWEWSKQKFESGNFTRQVTVKVDKPLQIEAEAWCNLHGSTGPKQAAVKVE
jgi:desulfoferrodoxin (superoxide reductase-like protein)